MGSQNKQASAAFGRPHQKTLVSPQGKASDLASRAHGFNDTLLKAPGHAVMESAILPLTAAEDGDLQTGLLLWTERGVRAVCAQGVRREVWGYSPLNTRETPGVFTTP